MSSSFPLIDKLEEILLSPVKIVTITFKIKHMIIWVNLVHQIFLAQYHPAQYTQQASAYLQEHPCCCCLSLRRNFIVHIIFRGIARQQAKQANSWGPGPEGGTRGLANSETRRAATACGVCSDSGCSVHNSLKRPRSYHGSSAK